MELKRKLDPKLYSFDEIEEWKFFDGHTVEMPTLFLMDEKRNPQFIMGYEHRIAYGYKTSGHTPTSRESVLFIDFIQRHRGADPARVDIRNYAEMVKRKMETATREARAFEARIGMFPSDFLMSEFVLRHAEEIKKGTKVLFDLNAIHKNSRENYLPLLKYFFKKSNLTLRSDHPEDMYELSLEKRRVRDILGA